MTEASLRELIALVPMRHHSERMPGKNYRDLAGRPLYGHILEALGQVPEIKRIVVDTDSPTIKDGIRRAYPHVQIIDRPEHLRAGELSVNRVLEHDVHAIQAAFYLQTHSTNPLLRPETIARAIRAFYESFPARDSLFSVTALHTRLWDPDGRPINHDPGELIRTQDLAPVFEENSCLYIFERERFLRRGNRIGERPLLFETPAEESIDIDDELAFELAEALLESHRSG